MKKRPFAAFAVLMIFSILWFNESSGQTSVNVATVSAPISTGPHSFSVGEMTLVNTLRTPSLIVTQGTLQPNENGHGPTGIVENALLLNVLVYPNPTENILFIQPQVQETGTMTITLLSLSGAQLHKSSFGITGQNDKHQIDLLAYAAGVYSLHLEFKSKENKVVQVKEYKINKIN